MKVLLFGFAIFFVFPSSQAFPPASCGQNQQNGPHCADIICGQPRAPCHKIIEGCHCKLGFERKQLYDEQPVEEMECVPHEECKNESSVETTTQHQHHFCPENQTYGPHCFEPRCNIVDRDLCFIRFPPGCHCKKGYRRDLSGMELGDSDYKRAHNAPCVLEEDCGEEETTPSITMATMGPTLPKCAENQTYGPHCGESICNIEDFDLCFEWHPSGCHCKPGYKRDMSGIKDAPCVLPEDCRKEIIVTTIKPVSIMPLCPENQTYGPHCAESACNVENIDPCFARIPPSCHCKEGYRRDYSGRNMSNRVEVYTAPCVLEEDCGEEETTPSITMATLGPALPECAENQTYGPHCGDTICNVINYSLCLEMYPPKCHCKPGYKRKLDRNHTGWDHPDVLAAPCVLEEDCETSPSSNTTPTPKPAPVFGCVDNQIYGVHLGELICNMINNTMDVIRKSGEN